MITEGLYIDDQTSQGYFFQPGIANPAQAAAWKRGLTSGTRSVVVSPALWKLRIVPYLSSTRDMQTMAR